MLRLTPSLPDLGRLYPWVDATAVELAIPARLLARVHVVLEEAVANAALHGFAGDGHGEIIVTLTGAEQGFRAVVEDDGIAFDPTSAPLPERPAARSELTVGGLGLGLIRRLCPDAVYVRINGRNRLTLRFIDAA